MTAHFYCWDPSIKLDPDDPDFGIRVDEIHDADPAVPSAKLRAFVKSLLIKHPDLTETDDTPWADGPMENTIMGDFINFSASWSWYNSDLAAFVAETANSHGLHCFDPQAKTFYPSQK